MENHKKRMLSLVISSFILSLSHQAAAETLRGVVATTVNTHPEVRIAAQIRNASNTTVDQARSGFYPSIDFNAGYGREKADNFSSNFQPNTLWRTDLGINARQPIFDGFAASNEVKRTKAKTNADALRVLGSAEDQALSAVQSYLDVLRNEELVAIARKNLNVHDTTYSMVHHLSEQGLGREADTEQTGGRVDLAKANLQSAENNLQNARITFQKVTGIVPHHLEKVPDVNPAVLPKTQEEALRRALAGHPVLKSATADIMQARGEYQASKSKFYPKLDFVLSGLQSKNVGGAAGPDHDRLAELQLNYNILQGGKDIAHVRETAFHIQQATEIRNRAEYQTIELMKLSWEAYQSTQARIPLLKAHEQASAATSASYKRQFQLNKRTILDVLDSQNEYYTAEQDLVNERYALLLAKYRILNAQGNLIQYLNIAPPSEATVPYPKI